MSLAESVSPPGILLFDSGAGGLSIGQSLKRRLPGVRLTFLADNAGFPYGNQPEEVVIQRTVQLVTAQLARHPADLVVVACNTASTVALPALRAVVRVPVVGVVPAIKPAAAISRNRRIGLLATPATIQRPYLDQLIGSYAADCEIVRVGQPDLVHWIEQWARGQSLPARELAETLMPFRKAGVDTVVLGCTHYPLIAGELQELLPEVRWWVDSGDAIARRAEFLLREQGRLPEGPWLAGPYKLPLCVFSGDPPADIGVFLARTGFSSTAPAPLPG